MGERLATEVVNKIRDIELLCSVEVTRISFIGHSLGGLIIRAALPHLEEYKEKMFTFMTFSTAHLGFLYHDDKLFKAGLTVFSKFDDTIVLK